jgi:hypothetical protein
MSFSDAESISTPIAIIYAVSTTDLDHIACLEELASGHHTPEGFKDVRTAPYISLYFYIALCLTYLLTYCRVSSLEQRP